MAIRRGNNLYWKTGLDNTGLKKGAVQAKGILKTMSQQITGMDLFAGLGIAATVAFAKVTKSAWDMAKGVDLAMREVQTISAATQENFDGMLESVRRLAKEGPEGAEGLSKALYQIVSAGYDGVEGLNLLEVATQAAVAGVTDTITAADGLTSAMNAWKIEASEAQSVADSFFTAVRLGKTTFGELAASIALVAPMASTLGVSLDEVNSAVASLTKQGTPTAVALTQIRQILISLNEHLGQGWRETMTFQEGMEELARMAVESGKDIKEYTGRIEGAIGIMGLTGENSEAARKDLEEFNNKLGASAKAYDIMRLAAENQIKVMKNRWHDKLLEYGNNIIKMFGRMANSLNSKAVIKALRDEAEAARLAVLDITTLAEGTEERVKAIEALQLLYPKYFGNLDAEKTKNEDLTTSLKLMNEEYANKIVLQEYADELVKVQREEDKLEKRRLQHIKALDLIGRKQASIHADTTEELIKQWEKILNDDSMQRMRNYLGGGVIKGVENAIEFLDEYDRKLEAIEGRKVGISELRDRILGLLKVSQGIDEGDPDFIGPLPAPEFEIPKPKTTFAGEELKKFQTELKEARQAYLEWNRFKNTSYADELKAEYDVYLKLGDNYEDYLKAKLKANKGHVEAQAVLLKELAEIEATPTRREIAMEEKWVEQQKRELEEAEAAILKFYDEYNKAIDDAIAKQLRADDKMIEQAEALYKNIQQKREQFAKRRTLKDEIKLIEDAYKANLISHQEFEQRKFDITKAYALKTLEIAQQDIRYVGDAMIDIFGEVSAEAAKSLEQVTSIVDKMVGAIQSYLKQDWLGLIINILGFIGEMFKSFDETDEIERRAKHLAAIRAAEFEALELEIEAVNLELERQLMLWEKMEGIDWYSGAHASVQLMQQDLNFLMNQMKEFRLSEMRFVEDRDDRDETGPTWERFDFDTSEWGIQDFENALITLTDIDDETREAIENLIENWWNIQDQLEGVQEAIRQELTGTTADSIMSLIVEGFEEGKRSAADFVETFESLMRDAVLNTFKRQFLQEQISQWYKTFAEFLGNEGGGDGIKEYDWGETGEVTPWEEGILTELWETIIENAREGYEQLEEMFGDLFEDTEDVQKQGLQGAIMGITEDTAGLIAGQFTAMRFNILELTEVAEDQLDALNEIVLNTANTNLALAIANDTLTRINRAVGGAA